MSFALICFMQNTKSEIEYSQKVNIKEKNVFNCL